MFSCNYDNKECSYGLKPWQNCTDRQGGVYCRKVFKNGICDPQCNNQNCLYDGFDCEGEMKRCNTFYEKYCQEHYANGYCDQGCNSSECEWDGLDCDTSPKQLARGTLIIIVLVKPEEFRSKANEFLRQLGHLMRAVLKIKKDENGDEMIYPWKQESDDKNYQGIIRVKRYLRRLFQNEIAGRNKRATVLTG